MLRLCFVLGNWHCIQSMWKMSKTFAKDRTVGQEELWRLINSRSRHQKEPRPWCYTWSFRTATNVLQSQRHVAESSSTQAWWVQNHFWKDGTSMTNTASLCQILGWLKSRLFSVTNLHLKITLMLWQKNKEFATRKGWANLRPDFVEAKRELKRLHDEHVKETSEGNTPTHPKQRSRQRKKQQFEGLEMIIKLILAPDGSLILFSHRETCDIQHLRPRHLKENSTTIGSQTKVEILGVPHPGLNSRFFWVQRCFLACRRVNSLAIDGKEGCRQIQLPHATFSQVQSLHRSHSTDDMCAWLKNPLSQWIVHSSTRHVSPCASQYTEHQHKFSLTYLSCVVLSHLLLLCYCRPLLRIQTCCPRIHPPWRSTAGWNFYGILLLNTFWAQENRAQQDYGQPIKSNFWRPGWYWGNWCETAPTRISKTSNYVRCWLHHCTYGNERNIKDKHEVIILNEKAWWSILLGILKCTEARSKCTTNTSLTLKTRNFDDKFFSRSRSFRESWCSVSCHSESNQNTFSEETEVMNQETDSREVFILFWDLLTRQMLGNHFLAETKISCIIKQGLNLQSRNIKGDLSIIVSMNFSNKLMLKDWNWETPMTDILNLEENNISTTRRIIFKGKSASRNSDTEYARDGRNEAQELRVDEFSVQKLRDTNNKGSLHKCRKCKSKWILWMIHGNFKKWNRITVGDCLTFPVNQQRFQVLVPCWAATNACHLYMEYVWTTGKRFW